jgi:hypothetical protein
VARFAAFFIPGLLIVAFNFVVFLFVGREIHVTMNFSASEKRESRKEFRVSLYVCLFVRCARASTHAT